MRVEAIKDRDSESTLFYLIPIGMREVCIQSGIHGPPDLSTIKSGDLSLFSIYLRENILQSIIMEN